MEFKGTKGPWILRVFPEGQMSVRTLDDTRKICVPRVQNHEESLYNLLLISKAPEMLEMLKGIVIRFEDNERLSMMEISILNNAKQLIKEATEL